ncbi:hypothetical protein ES703_69570 [subsurface metagenome]
MIEPVPTYVRPISVDLISKPNIDWYNFNIQSTRQFTANIRSAISYNLNCHLNICLALALYLSSFYMLELESSPLLRLCQYTKMSMNFCPCSYYDSFCSFQCTER